MTLVSPFSQVIWTQEVGFAMRAGEGRLAAYIDKSNAQLDAIVELVRGELSAQARLTLGALVVIEVHARDVVQQLVDSKVSKESDFDWLAQVSSPCFIFYRALTSSWLTASILLGGR
jgi:dynein heavy chain